MTALSARRPAPPPPPQRDEVLVDAAGHEVRVADDQVAGHDATAWVHVGEPRPDCPVVRFLMNVSPEDVATVPGLGTPSFYARRRYVLAFDRECPTAPGES